MLGQHEHALTYYTQALRIAEEIPDPYGKGTILQNAALVYSTQARYDVTLACLLVARSLFTALQSPYSTETQRRIDTIQHNIGTAQFMDLVAAVESNAHDRVDQAFFATGP